MARRKNKAKAPSVVLFNVVYQDGTLSSNRKVPGDLLGGLDGDAPARTVIEEQDQVIAQRSGQRKAPIKSIVRA